MTEKSDQQQSEKAQDEALDPLAEATILDLREQGIEPTLSECIAINDASRLVSNANRDIAAAGCPVLVGNDVWMWPLTVQACRWLARASGWSGEDGDELSLLITAFAYTHSRDYGIFDYLAEPARGVAAVVEWAASCPVTYSELLRGLELVTADDPEVDEDAYVAPVRGGASLSSMVAALVDKTGIAPDYWERRASMDYIMQQAYTAVAQHAATGEGFSDADPWVQANQRLGLVEERIKAAHGEA